MGNKLEQRVREYTPPDPNYLWADEVIPSKTLREMEKRAKEFDSFYNPHPDKRDILFIDMRGVIADMACGYSDRNSAEIAMGMMQRRANRKGCKLMVTSQGWAKVGGKASDFFKQKERKHKGKFGTPIQAFSTPK